MDNMQNDITGGGTMMTSVVCLCGSTRFKAEFEHMAEILTLQGYEVLMPTFFSHNYGELYKLLNDQTKESLDELSHLRIMNSDVVFVINPGGYIGSSTKSEIAFAKRNEKPIYYLEELKE